MSYQDPITLKKEEASRAEKKPRAQPPFILLVVISLLLLALLAMTDKETSVTTIIYAVAPTAVSPMTINVYQPEAAPLPAPACNLRNPDTAGQLQMIVIRQIDPTAVTGLVYHTVDCRGMPVSIAACAGLSQNNDCVATVPEVIDGEMLYLEIQTTQGNTWFHLNLGAPYWELTPVITREQLP
jgi:hypothetical protein